MPWRTTSCLASSRKGMMWPMPGLGRTATWTFMVSDCEMWLETGVDKWVYVYMYSIGQLAQVCNLQQLRTILVSLCR